MGHNNTKNNSYGFALFLIGCLFFIFGFITWSNSQLIPYLKLACQLSDTQSYFVASAFFAAYFVMSIPSAEVLKLTGFKKGMSLGLLIMALGTVLFIPAANSRSYPMFLTGLFITGTGLALLQTASNPYVTVLGRIESAASRISIMGICNKLAGILAVYILGSITLKNADALKQRLQQLQPAAKEQELQLLASKVIGPYMIITAVLVTLAVVLYFLHLPEIKDEENTASADTATAQKSDSLWSYPHLLLGALAIFFYVGAEVISYDTFAGFGEALGYKLDVSKHFAVYTGWGLLAGYVLSIFAIPQVISQRTALIVAVVLSMVMVVAAMVTKGHTAVVCFALLGFTNSVMWPAIWPLSLTGVGRFTKLGGALLVMCIVGGAVLPPLYAELAKAMHSKQLAYVILIPCYLYILFFAVRGYKPRKA